MYVHKTVRWAHGRVLPRSSVNQSHRREILTLTRKHSRHRYQRHLVLICCCTVFLLITSMRHIKLRGVAEDIVEDIHPVPGNNPPISLYSLAVEIMVLFCDPFFAIYIRHREMLENYHLRWAGESVQGGEDYETNLTEEETAILSRSFRSADFDNDASLTETEMSMAISRETKQHITVSWQRGALE